MSIFKRLTATLSVQVDQLVGEIENHDAVVAARLAELDGAPSLDLDETFERREIRITESEVTADAGSDADDFAAAFDANEEQDALQAELAELKGNRHQTREHGEENDHAR